jgi:alpha-N-acetylglucosamine transferase
MKYIDLLYLSIRSVRKYNKVDILIICDESMVTICSNKLKEFKNIWIVQTPDSIGPMEASIKKLTIFDYDISKYKKIMLIDSDILVDIHLTKIFDKVVDDKVYAFAEHKLFGFHAKKYHSLLKYTEYELDFFVKNKIYPFCAGFFVILNTPIMKQHFSNVLGMIDGYVGEYHYEQSFMNVYFNKLNLVDTNIINSANHMMNIDFKYLPRSPWIAPSFKNKIFHFSFARGADNKLKEMVWWNNKYLQ